MPRPAETTVLHRTERRLETRLLPLTILIVLAACSGGPSESPGGSAEPGGMVSANPSTTGSASPTSLPPVLAGDWERVPDQPALRSVQLLQVAWTGARFVAFGGDGHFLDSVDGRTWHLQDQSWPGAYVSAFTAGNRGIVAVGALDGRAASWFSNDGLVWTTGPDDPSLHAAPGGQMGMGDVTESDGGWIAVGAEAEECHIGCPTGARAVVWTSADAIHWTQVPASESLANAVMSGVSRGGDGFVAVGASVGMPTAAVVWTSGDGRSWSKVDDDLVFHAPAGTDQTFGAGMSAITTGKDGILVAVGQVSTQGETGSALAWWSTDGQTWHPADGERFLYGQLFDVASVPTGFLATGPSGANSCLGGIWSSPDGRSWKCVASDPAFADFAAYAAAGYLDVEVVVGFGPPNSLAGGAPAASAWVRSVQ